jgi:hypothetical protein
MTGMGYAGLWGTSMVYGGPALAIADWHGLCETGIAVGTGFAGIGYGGLALGMGEWLLL